MVLRTAVPMQTDQKATEEKNTHKL